VGGSPDEAGGAPALRAPTARCDSPIELSRRAPREAIAGSVSCSESGIGSSFGAHANNLLDVTYATFIGSGNGNSIRFYNDQRMGGVRVRVDW